MGEGAVTNPKHAAGRAKASFRCIPPIALFYEGAVMQGGADKYGAFNWGEAGVVASVYYDAALRHMMAWYAGEDLDPESGLPHLAHARACFGIVLDCWEKGILEDDRPRGKTAPVGPKMSAKPRPIDATQHSELLERRIPAVTNSWVDNVCICRKIDGELYTCGGVR